MSKLRNTFGEEEDLGSGATAFELCDWSPSERAPMMEPSGTGSATLG
jgi:hypothetical protein